MKAINIAMDTTGNSVITTDTTENLVKPTTLYMTTAETEPTTAEIVPTESKTAIFIGAGCAAGVVLFIIVIITVYCLRRRYCPKCCRKQNTALPPSKDDLVVSENLFSSFRKCV